MRLSALRVVCVCVGLALLATGLRLPIAHAERGAEEHPEPIAPEEYAIYNRIVESKFLTSATTMVLIRRPTATHIGLTEMPFKREFFEAQQLFDGALPDGLVEDFLFKTRLPSTLEPKFDFGVRYRLIMDVHDEDKERISWPAVPRSRRPVEYDAVTILLEFSRVAFTPQEDRALVYVGNYRPDGTGAGLLFLLGRQAAGWAFVDTEIIWTAGAEPNP